jgi:NMD protein affecting ribosome stability and mRNA decay
MKAINLTLCSCDKYLEKSIWKPYSNIEKLIADKVKKQIPQSKIIFKSFEMPMIPKEKKEIEVIAKLKDKEHVVKVILKLVKCELCAREGTQYFEAILQVRSLSTIVLEKGIDLLKRRVENLRNRGVFINKVEQVGDGFDLFLTNQRIAQSLGRELYESFGGVFKVSPRIFTRNKQTSKDLYRMSILVRLPDFETGDVLINHDKVFKIDKTGTKIKLLDIENSTYATTEYAKMHYHVLKAHTTYVSRVHPYVEVINPYDFQSSMVKNKSLPTLELGQEVKVVVHNGIYIVE